MIGQQEADLRSGGVKRRTMRVRIAPLLLALSLSSNPLIAGLLSIRESLPRLHDAERGISKQAIESLVEHGIGSLNAFYAEFDQLDNMDRYYFRTQVIPKLPPQETSRMLLGEIRKGLPVAEQGIDLQLRESAGEKSLALASEFARIEQPFRRWRWTLQAVGNLGHPEGYDLVLPIYLKHTRFRGVHSDLVHALFGIDSKRALLDFEALLSSDQPEQRAQGIWSFLQIGKMPRCDTLRPFFTDHEEKVRQAAHQLVYRMERECIDLLIDLSGHDSLQIRNGADMRLRMIGHVPSERATEMMTQARSAHERQEVWRAWWMAHHDDSDEELRRLGLQDAIRIAGEHLSADIASFLADYPEEPEVYPFIKQALVAPDPSLRKAGVGALRTMIHTGSKRAVEFIIAFCLENPLEATVPLVGVLPRVEDQRIVPLLVKMLKQVRKDQRSWSCSILHALGKTGDRRAVEPVLGWLVEKTDGSEQIAARVLPQLEGAKEAQSQLLSLLIKQDNHNTRFALRHTIASIGGAALPAQLTSILPKAPQGDYQHAGPLSDVLQLMEKFPDAASRPHLRELLKGSNRFAHLYAARVLGKLGDYSGVPVVLNDLFTKQVVPYHFYAHDVGAALREIAAPGTKARLLALFGNVDGEDRHRVLRVIAQQENTEYLSFLGQSLSHDDDEVVHGASNGIAMIIYRQTHDGQRIVERLDKAKLLATRRALLWAFEDRKMRAEDPTFPDHGLLKKLDGAFLKVGNHQRLLFKVADKSIVVLDPLTRDDAQTIERLEAEPDQSLGYGKVTLLEYAGYLSVTLGIDYGGSSYLFRLENGGWTPVCGQGGWIE